jgi:hypothetical protein
LESTIADGAFQLEQQRPARIAVPLADLMRQDQFRCALDCDERPAIPERFAVAASNASLFFAADERPEFVNLNVVNRYVADDAVQEALAIRADDQDKIVNRIAVQAGQSLDSADAHSFQDHT